MATEQNIAEYIAAQIHNNGAITYKKMFGEYGIYANGKIFGFICDNRLLIKPTDEGKAFAHNASLAQAYPGSKDYILIEDQIEDIDWLSQLVNITLHALPEPKPKKKKKEQ